MTLNKRLAAALAVLLIMGGLMLGMLLRKGDGPVQAPERSKAWEAFTLSGKGQYWQLSDYKVIRTSSSIYRGKGSLSYRGNPSEIDESTYFGYSLYERQSSGESCSVHSHTSTSVNGPVGILDSIQQLGAIEGEPSTWELAETVQDFDNAYMEMSWRDNQGEMHTENIPLKVTEAYSSLN
ncbi:hypothetical protein ACTHPF_13810 [Paenibacillus sp. SAF-054]|uniref:hypothetical protein n=1 Tax=unclassified Paenibacillus TaxID=185978 RepID=UPI003F7E7DBC